MSKFLSSLHLIFLARQGYWSESAEVKNLSLVQLIYKYLLSAFCLALLFLVAGKEVFILLQESRIQNTITYFQFCLILIPLILIIGVIYENIYVIKSNTISMARIFFNITPRELLLLLVVKNVILVSPLLICISFYNILYGAIGLLSVVILTSFIFFPKAKNVRFKVKKGLNLSYLLSIIDSLTIIKVLMTPVFSTFLFMFLYTLFPKLVDINLSDQYSIMMSGLISGFIFFGSRGLNFYFLSLNTDLMYLKAIRINVKKFIIKKMAMMGMITLFLPTMSIILFLYAKSFAIDLIAVFLFGVFISFLISQGLQAIEVLFYRKFSFKDAKELDSYHLPLRSRVLIYMIRALIVVMSLLFNHIKLFHLPTLMIVNILLSSLILYFSIHFVLSQLIDGGNHVHFNR